MGGRLTWPQICQHREYQGRWVALDECRYDSKTARPVEGSVIDADEDLVALCARMKASDSRHCSILFCEEVEPPEPEIEPRSRRAPARASH